jgi:hypothetical protein
VAVREGHPPRGILLSPIRDSKKWVLDQGPEPPENRGEPLLHYGLFLSYLLKALICNQ